MARGGREVGLACGSEKGCGCRWAACFKCSRGKGTDHRVGGHGGFLSIGSTASYQDWMVVAVHVHTPFPLSPAAASRLIVASLLWSSAISRRRCADKHRPGAGWGKGTLLTSFQVRLRPQRSRTLSSVPEGGGQGGSSGVLCGVEPSRVGRLAG